MSKFKTAVKLLKGDKGDFCALIVKNLSFLFPDKLYLTLLYRCTMGYWINWKSPKTFNEKLQWLKLYDRKPEYTTMVDKYAVKEYVASKIGMEYINPTIGVWDTIGEIDWDKLPKQFVLKTTHGGGGTGVVICKNRENFDKKEAIARLKLSLKHDIYKKFREWPYKNVQRKIIAENYLEDEKTGELRDYKFFCFNGKVKALFVATERQRRDEPFFNFFDENFKQLNVKQGHPVSLVPPAKPELFDQMKRLAEVLSKDLSCVRIDFYQANGKIYFGEFTFYHFGGIVPFEPNEWDYKFGSWITLPNMAN